MVSGRNKIVQPPKQKPNKWHMCLEQNFSLSITKLYKEQRLVSPVIPCSLASLFTCCAQWQKILLPYLYLADSYSYFGPHFKNHFFQKNPKHVLDTCFRVLSTYPYHNIFSCPFSCLPFPLGCPWQDRDRVCFLRVVQHGAWHGAGAFVKLLLF